ncbi:MAG: PepSY-associated TM helix domain-containing protein [Bacteroidota bacterium]
MVTKKVVRLIHLWLGLSSGLVVCLLCLSGALFVFAEEIMHAYNKQHLHVEQGDKRLPVDHLVDTFKAEFPGEQYFWINTYNDPTRSFDVVSGIATGEGMEDIKLKLTFLNPYTGQVIGEDHNSANWAFITAHFHSQLMLGEVGLWIIRIASLIFLVELILGVILWWPRSKNESKSAFKPKYPASRKRINHDLHRVYGFYACWVLLISVTTGLVMSFDWVEKPIIAAFGGNPELVGQTPPMADVSEGLAFKTRQFMFESFEKAYPEGYKLTFHALRPDSTTSQFVLIDRDNRFLHLYGDNQIWDRYTGKQLEKPLVAEFEKNQDILEGNLNIHMGTIGGWPTQVLALLIGLFGASLPITGFFIWWGRRKKKPSRKYQSREEIASKSKDLAKEQEPVLAMESTK